MIIIDTFEQITCDIIADPLFQETKRFMHHGCGNSVYDHSVATALTAFFISSSLGFRPEAIRSVTRAALLHDFFGYDWHGDWFKEYSKNFTGWQRFRHMHAFIHGDIAAARAYERFGISRKQQNAIASHMFPLSFCFPRSAEAWILTLSDKAVATREVARTAQHHAICLYRKVFPVL